MVLHVEQMHAAPDDASAEDESWRRSRSFIIDDELVSTIDGRQYMQLSRKHNVMRRIMTMSCPETAQCGARHGTPLNMSDIPDQMVAARDIAMRKFIAGSDHATKLPKKWARVKTLKRWKAALATLPDVMAVTTPHVNGVASITANIATTLKGGPVSMEITDESLSWLTRAVAAQVASGEVHSQWRKGTASADVAHGESSSEELQCI